MTETFWNATEAARIVVESGAVYTHSAGDPFFFTSGWASPVFVDIKRLISLPPARDLLVSMALQKIRAVFPAGSFEVIAGCELAGIPFAAIMADRLRMPLVVVRKQGKGFGRLAQFEGAFEPGARTLQRPLPSPASRPWPMSSRLPNTASIWTSARWRRRRKAGRSEWVTILANKVISQRVAKHTTPVLGWGCAPSQR